MLPRVWEAQCTDGLTEVGEGVFGEKLPPADGWAKVLGAGDALCGP